jgi:hypothetical protein
VVPPGEAALNLATQRPPTDFRFDPFDFALDHGGYQSHFLASGELLTRKYQLRPFPAIMPHPMGGAGINCDISPDSGAELKQKCTLQPWIRTGFQNLSKKLKKLKVFAFWPHSLVTR